MSRRKRLTSEEIADERRTEPRSRWISEVFFPALDTAMAILKEKFIGQRSVLLSLAILLPSSFSSLESEGLEEKLDPVLKQFGLESEKATVLEEFTDFRELCVKYNPTLFHQHLSIPAQEPSGCHISEIIFVVQNPCYYPLFRCRV